MDRQFDDKLGISGLRGNQGKYFSLRSKAPILFQLVRTTSLVAVPGLKAKELLKILEIRLSRKVLVERQFDDKLGISGLRGKQGEYYSSRTKAEKLFRLVRTSPLGTGSGLEAIVI